MSGFPDAVEPGSIVILTGPPRAGKTSIATAMQNELDGVWMNLGVDHFKRMTPCAARSS